jgi:hypothetical protein
MPIWTKFKSDSDTTLIKLMMGSNNALRDGLDSLKVSTDAIMKNQQEMQNTIKDIEKQLNANLGSLDEKLKQEINQLTNTVKEDVPKLWSDVVRTNTQTQVPVQNNMVEQVKRALYEVAESDKEQEIRSRGIVVYKVPEEENESKGKRADDDRKILEELIEFIGCNEAQIMYAERLGRFDPDRCKERKFRPIKVRFSDSKSRDKVLSNLYKLKNAPDTIKHLSIRQDLNNLQREELRRMQDKAFKKSQESTDTFYRVKGEPGNYRLFAVAKKAPAPPAPPPPPKN